MRKSPSRALQIPYGPDIPKGKAGTGTKFRKSSGIRASPRFALHSDTGHLLRRLDVNGAKRGQARSFAKAAKFEPAPVLRCILMQGTFCAALRGKAGTGTKF